MKEVWKDIPGYEGLYKISNTGKIESVERMKWNGSGYQKLNSYLKKIYTTSLGYPMVDLYKNNSKTTFYMHRLLAQVFIANPRGVKYINHIDGNKENNSLDNLEWCTQSENVRHGMDTGLNNVSEAVNFNKVVKGWSFEWA